MESDRDQHPPPRILYAVYVEEQRYVLLLRCELAKIPKYQEPSVMEIRGGGSQLFQGPQLSRYETWVWGGGTLALVQTLVGERRKVHVAAARVERTAGCARAPRGAGVRCELAAAGFIQNHLTGGI